MTRKSPTQEEAPLPGAQRLELVPVSGADLPLLEQLARAYYLEDGHTFRADRQPAALAALASGDPFGCAWLIRLEVRPVGYVVLALTFSVEAGGREACVDEFYLVPEARNRGLGSRALALVEAEARELQARRLRGSRPFPDVEVPRRLSPAGPAPALLLQARATL
jgi:GNAT superfamily N-acetyltransferase